MSELDDELDDLRGRVACLAPQEDAASSGGARAGAVAGATGRQPADPRSKRRWVVPDLQAGTGQVISPTSPAACLPARLPENTQSASDKPLT
jgi:hypothetical protein